MLKVKLMKRDTGKTIYREVPPNAARTMAALREMGYDSFAAVMDLIDNSIDAGATSVDVVIKELGAKSLAIDILDDGKGMDAKILAEALRLGSDIDHDAKKDLGKFGLGLKTASISLARRMWILTRQEGKTAVESVMDLDTIAQENRFVITEPKAAASATVLKTVGDHGTLIRLEKIDRISDTNVSRFAQNLRIRLGQVYRHALKNGMKLTVNGRKVLRYDPLMLDHPETSVVLDQKIDLGDGTYGVLKVVELPDLGTQGDMESGIFPHNSGFYVCRNNREIIAGDTFGFYRHHHSYSHFRAELSYAGDSTMFHEDVKKTGIHPDPRLMHKLRELTEKYIIQSGRRGRERSEDKPLQLNHKAAEERINAALARLNDSNGKTATPDKATSKNGKKAAAEAAAKSPMRVRFAQIEVDKKGRWFHAEKKGDELIIYWNTKHPLVRLVADLKQRQAQTILDWVAVAISQAEMEIPDCEKLMEKAGDYLAFLATLPPPTQE